MWLVGPVLAKRTNRQVEIGKYGQQGLHATPGKNIKIHEHMHVLNYTQRLLTTFPPAKHFSREEDATGTGLRVQHQHRLESASWSEANCQYSHHRSKIEAVDAVCLPAMYFCTHALCSDKYYTVSQSHRSIIKLEQGSFEHQQRRLLLI